MKERSPPKATPKNRPFVLFAISKDRIFHILSSIVEYSEQILFDSYRSKVIIDNSANAHKCSEKFMFTDKIEPIISNVVATIGEKYLIPKCIFTVIWSWTGDEGQLHTNKLNTLLYFPYSTANILSTTKFD